MDNGSPEAPRFTVITLTNGADTKELRKTIASVRRQTWEDWRHVIMQRGPGSAALDKVLNWASEDPRVMTIRQHAPADRAEAGNAAFAASTGRWLALLEDGDELDKHALARMAAALDDAPGAVLAYSDWRRTDLPGRDDTSTFLKPDWSPERLRWQEYLSGLTVLSADAVARIDGYRPGYADAVDHDLLLRITEDGGQVVHVPEPLYLRRGEPALSPVGREAGARAVQEHCDRLGLSVRVIPSTEPGFYEVHRSPTAPHAISVVIPTAGGSGSVFGSERVMVVEAVRSMVARTDLDFEVVIVADPPFDAPYLAELADLLGPRLMVVEYDKPFNFSEKVNLGALHATGDIVVFANDDLEIISDRWLEQMVGLAEQEDVGLVGALLYFEDGTIQHAGHQYVQANAFHIHLRQRSETGYFGDLLTDHEVSGATAALVACRKSVWREVGAFTSRLPGNFNDVDFCMKIGLRGYRIVQACSVRAWHFESQSRDPRVEAWEVELLHTRWLHRMGRDRFFPRPPKPPRLAEKVRRRLTADG